MDQSSRARGSNSGLLFSLEATLDEENKEVLAGLSKQRSRSPNPPGQRNRTPPAYRSMLDVDPSVPRHGSIPGSGVASTNPRGQRKLSNRLDPLDPSTWTSKAKPTPPSARRPSQSPGPEVPQGLPKIQVDMKPDFEQTYNFDMASMPLSGGGAKSTQDKRPREGSNGGGNFDSTDRRGSNQQKTPVKAYNPSSSNPTMLSPDSPQAKPRSPSGSALDEKYRRLSNKSNSFSTITSESDEASTRVMADDEGDEEVLVESSSEDEKRVSSSDDESPDTARGRKRGDAKDDTTNIKETVVERKDAPQSQGVRSLIEPILSPSVPKPPSGEVHPPSSFGRSGPTAADFADDDDVESDIQKAKNMGMLISALDSSVPDRHVRMIIRGGWAKLQDETENNNNSSPRLYLACTDLSTEASYAMEWTVGTMLRDGDTLLAIYAIEDENAPKEAENNTQVHTESVKAAQDASDTMAVLTRQTTNSDIKPVTKFVPAIDAPTASNSVDLKSLPRKDYERVKAIDDITANFLKLVRKTPLQIRCMVEVIHCKSPKHLILNAIDVLEPTLCVVGTRGRSSLKGVLLGSFSNYLVTKSSVPVMVARKRLKKPAHAKVNAAVKMSNNLSSRKRRDLASARID